jgi:hypothetical protein
MHLNRFRRIGGAASALIAFAILLPCVTSVQAQQRYYDGRYHEYTDNGRYRDYHENSRFGERYAYDVFRIATDRGYDTGFDRGTDDAKRHKNPNPGRSSHFRDGDSGYHKEYGDIEAYRHAYREGFHKGYATAYRKYHDYYYGRDSHYDRDSYYGRDRSYGRDYSYNRESDYRRDNDYRR